MKPIIGFPGYFIDEHGDVFSKWSIGHSRIVESKEPKKLKAIITCYGYRSICLVRDGKHIQRRIARLVLEAFVGPAPKDLVARHGKNGKKDDSLSNLSWGTQRENMFDKKRDGTLVKGTKHWKAKLTIEKVKEIREMGKKNKNRHEIAAKFGIHPDTVRDILNNRTWKNV